MALNSDPPTRSTVDRFASGVPGLDTLLGGGLIRANLYLVEGVAGAGKTVLATQLASTAVRQGGTALYLTLLAESHGKLLQHVRDFTFFDERAVGSRFIMISALTQLLDHGLQGLHRFVAEQLHAHRPTLLLIDGFGSAMDCAESPSALARFMHELNSLVSAAACTSLLLTHSRGPGWSPEQTLVDGVIELQRAGRGLRRAHRIEVHKLRGTAHLKGQHMFHVSADGIVVFPRLEALRDRSSVELERSEARRSSGLQALDRMTMGGYPVATATCVLGPPGVGKTLLGLHFLAARLADGARAVYVGFSESTERLLLKAERVGLPLREPVAEGRLQIRWCAPTEFMVDAIAHGLLQRADAEGFDCLVIDGLEGLHQGAMYPKRMPRFLAALTVELRQRGITTLVTQELPVFSDVIESDLSLSAPFDNLLLMRYFEHAGDVRRLLAVLKLRDSDFDSSIREFTISGQGLQLGERLSGLHDALSGRPLVIGRSLGSADGGEG
jgi:circadian clock protein KaiC